MTDRSELEAELARVRASMAKLRRPRVIPVLSIEWYGAAEAVLHVADFGVCPRVREVVESIDTAGDRAM